MQIIQDYRALHRIPELGSQLPKTVQYVTNSLLRARCRVFSPIEGSVCGFFNFSQAKTIAFRADMDALPIKEQADLPFASRHPGAMHACGHDGHTAVLLETARRIRPCGYNILLIFQPAEETDGGAKKICDTGLLEQYRVCAVFALHLWPGLPKGKIYSRPGELMCSSAGVTAEFSGKSVHIANCRRGTDALCACCRFYRMAQNLPCFLKFGRLYGGTAGNVVCDRAVLEGTLRTKRDSHQKIYREKIKSLCRQACQGTGCQGFVQFSGGYPAVRNDPVLFEKVKKLWDVRHLSNSLWTTEDFSCYQEKVPGVYVLLGVGDTPPLHSPGFCFDENVLTQGADFFETLVNKL